MIVCMAKYIPFSMETGIPVQNMIESFISGLRQMPETGREILMMSPGRKQYERDSRGDYGNAQ